MTTDTGPWLTLTREDPIEPQLPIVDPHHHLWDYPTSRYLLEDLLADTGPHGALTILLRDRHAAALGLYMAFGNGMIRLLTHELICAFDAFIQDRRWDPLIRASRSVRQHAVSHAQRVMELFARGRQRHDPKGTREAIEDFMRRQGWLSN